MDPTNSIAFVNVSKSPPDFPDVIFSLFTARTIIDNHLHATTTDACGRNPVAEAVSPQLQTALALAQYHRDPGRIQKPTGLALDRPRHHPFLTYHTRRAAFSSYSPLPRPLPSSQGFKDLSLHSLRTDTSFFLSHIFDDIDCVTSLQATTFSKKKIGKNMSVLNCRCALLF